MKTFSKEEAQMAKKTQEKCSSSLAIKDANQNHTNIPPYFYQYNNKW
jgi:hypothetical protein